MLVQISKYVEREIMNHKQLRHPHIVELREVRASSRVAWHLMRCAQLATARCCGLQAS